MRTGTRCRSATRSSTWRLGTAGVPLRWRCRSSPWGWCSTTCRPVKNTVSTSPGWSWCGPQTRKIRVGPLEVPSAIAAGEDLRVRLVLSPDEPLDDQRLVVSLIRDGQLARKWHAAIPSRPRDGSRASAWRCDRRDPFSALRAGRQLRASCSTGLDESPRSRSGRRAGPLRSQVAAARAAAADQRATVPRRSHALDQRRARLGHDLHDYNQHQPRYLPTSAGRG